MGRCAAAGLRSAPVKSALLADSGIDRLIVLWHFAERRFPQRGHMTKRHKQRQGELIPRSKRPAIPISSSHEMVVLADELDWDDLLDSVEEIRSANMQKDAGRPPHLRALVVRLRLWVRKQPSPWARAEQSCGPTMAAPLGRLNLAAQRDTSSASRS